jgi:hypothetical protein
MATMSEMATGLLDTVCVAVHTPVTPTRLEWGEFMDALRKVPLDQLRILAITDGGGPDAIERAEFLKYIGQTKVPIAVVSDAIVVRGIVTALSWFNTNIHTFAPTQFEAALRHLEVPAPRVPELRALARTLSSRLSAKQVRAMANV